MRTLPLLLFAFALNSTLTNAQTDKPGGGPPPPPRPEAVSTEAAMELKDDRPQPKKTISELSTHHRRLNDYTGSWKEVITTWASKKTEPRVDSMMCSISMIMDNHQQATHKGMINGERFAGISTISCDTANGQYTSTWIDNSSTAMTIMTGKWEPKNNTLVFTGEEIDPETKVKVAVREVHSLSPDNKNRFRIEVFKAFPKKDEFRTMRIDFERVVR